MQRTANPSTPVRFRPQPPNYLNILLKKYNLRFQKVNSQIQNTARVKIVRRSIAKILTFLNQKKKDN